MNTDFRIKIGFSRHPKTLKLKRRLGADGVLALIALWEYTALNKPDGVLAGMDREDIALAAGWDGDSDPLVDALVKVGWLDETPDGYRVHDWEQHNEWAAKAEDRSEYFRDLAAKRKRKGRFSSNGGENSAPQNAAHNDTLNAPQNEAHNDTLNAPYNDTHNGTLNAPQNAAHNDTQNAASAVRITPIPSSPLPSSPTPSSPLPSSPLPSHPYPTPSGAEAVEDSPTEEVDAADAAAPPMVDRPAAKSARLWEAYALSYQDRYGVEPVRNAKVNRQLCQVVDRLGREAPAVTGFYVRHNNAWYVKRGHSVDCLLADCEKLRTEWATGQQITAAHARNLDQHQTTVSLTERLIEKFRREGKLIEEPAHAS